VRERPILFSAPMVKAILAGTKTQTRRVVTAPKCATLHGRSPDFSRAFVDPGPSPAGNPGPYLKLPYSGGDLGDDELVERVYPRWFVGDRLWVRETLRMRPSDEWEYAADGTLIQLDRGDPRVPAMVAWAHHKEEAHCVSIHMPRWASRLTLEVTSIRVERLQDITEEDALAEGVGSPEVNPLHNQVDDAPDADGIGWQHGDARYLFRSLWDSINGKRPGCSWEANPWLWVVSFKRIEQASKGAAA
jgi:hypothetical protein